MLNAFVDVLFMILPTVRMYYDKYRCHCKVTEKDLEHIDCNGAGLGRSIEI